MLNLLSDEDLVRAAAQDADPKVREALEKGQAAAQRAIAVGGGWAAFAAIVGNAGYAPYILAAQLSAWIPMVSGPALVSLLATLINPVTVLVGIGALAWWSGGKSAGTVRSQVAARLCVILSISGARNREEGLAQLIADMRRLDGADTKQLAHLSAAQRDALRKRLSFMNARLTRAMPDPAGAPPPPWNTRPQPRKPSANAIEVGGIEMATAGEMLWSAAAIDERVISAADFSRTADLGNPLSFALHAQEFVLRGAFVNLRGYVAERLVLDELVAQGHHVVLAGSSNTPGLDLNVDGSPVQV